jgi:hypothetical protein
MVGGQFYDLGAPPGEKAPGTHWIRGYVRPRADGTLTGIEPRS